MSAVVPVGHDLSLQDMRYDLQVIASLVQEKSRILDLGCGEGDLLRWLTDHKGVTARGVEISEEAVRACISGGLSVFHGDINEGLADYADGSFDLVILSQTLQMVQDPARVMQEMLRVGKRAIVSFPNFGHWRIRLQFSLFGRAPKTRSLPYEWYNTPNIRVLTILDFRQFCRQAGMDILTEIPLTFTGASTGRVVRFHPNLMAQYGVYLLSAPGSREA